MRVNDYGLPTVGGSRPTSGWQTGLFVTLGRLPIAAYQWDDFEAAWDDPEGDYSWDDLDNWPYDRIDATCDWQGLEITSGTADPEGRFQAASAVLTLDNRSGEWSQYDSRGRLVGYGPGTPLDIWMVTPDDGEPWWLFRGRVSGWQESATSPATPTVEITAFDRFSDFNEDPGVEWNPGIYGESPADRIGRILDRWGYPEMFYARHFDTGRVTLHAFASQASPLEEIQAVALSDGGVFFIDADATITYRDRDWLGGREDQTEVRRFSDNVCDDATVVWDPVVLTDDDTIVNVATLTNLAEVVVESVNWPSFYQYGPQNLPKRDKDQWVTQVHGKELADHIVRARAEGYLRIEGFTLRAHLDQWLPVVDMRLGDLVQFIRDQHGTTGAARLSLLLIVRQIAHSITPVAWVTTFGTSRATGNLVAYQWDAGPWLTWDSTYYWDGQPA